MASVSESPRIAGVPAPWLDHYPAEVPHSLTYPQRPVWAFLEQSAHDYPDRIACWFYEEHLTYAQLYTQARKAAAAFTHLGVRPGDRVGVLLPNMPEYLVAAYGAWMVGAAVVPISPLLVAEEITELLRATECRVVVSLDLLAPLVLQGDVHPEYLLLASFQDRLTQLQRLGYRFVRFKRFGWHRVPHTAQIRDWSDELRHIEGDGQDGFDVSLDAPAYILATGGTTGAPKAVVLSHRNLVSNAWQLYHWGGARVGSETFLAVLPFFHSYGLTTCATTGVALAATLVMYPRFNSRKVLRLIERHHPTIFHAVPAMLAALNENLRRRRRKPIEGLQFVISGGATLDPGISREFAEHTGATVVEGYGLSEASPVTHVGPLDGTNRMGTIGLPLPDTAAKIVDAETGTRTLPAGEVGELCIHGPQVMVGYLDNPEATAAVLKDGWLYTGDLAVCDDDGFFRIVDRKKDLIITSGFNVYPTEVEVMLRRCPEVAEVAVVGVPDAAKGEVVKAIIVPANPGTFHQHVLERYIQEHLAHHKRPRVIELVNELPRNFLGKVLRRKLRENPGDEDNTSELEAGDARDQTHSNREEHGE